MGSVTVRVPAKINLSLGVGPRRDDGFHSLATVYQSVNLFDEIRASASADEAITISVQAEEVRDITLVPTDESNIAVQAAQLLRQHIGESSGAHLAIRKSIPVAGGMAGGSADAAAALVACNELWGANLSRTELEGLAAELGSDVPFCLHGGVAMGAGHGEQISTVLAAGTYHWVFAIAEDGVSTAEVYQEFDRLNADREVREPSVDPGLLAALRAADPVALGEALSNDLSEATLSLRPELAATLEVGQSCDALGSLISGSGPTVMFLAADQEHAVDIALGLMSARVCADAVHGFGPVPGARIV